jgi:phosphonate transport system substrate-binding protein
VGLSRRGFLTVLLLSACGTAKSLPRSGGSLLVGTVSYDEGSEFLSRYGRFQGYLSNQIRQRVELEPTLNETRALEQIQRRAWSLVFAPPGLSAIALSEFQYKPLFPLFGVQNLRSVLVVRQGSAIQTIRGVDGKTLALGQPGSATGYYFPLFNLYGLTLAKLIISPTPQAILNAVSQGKADVGAVSLAEFETYKSQAKSFNLRILATDPHPVPLGAVLISPTMGEEQQISLKRVLSQTPSVLAEEMGFVTNAKVPDYQFMISVVQRVRSIFPADRKEGLKMLRRQPVKLFTSARKSPGYPIGLRSI